MNSIFESVGGSGIIIRDPIDYVRNLNEIKNKNCPIDKSRLVVTRKTESIIFVQANKHNHGIPCIMTLFGGAATDGASVLFRRGGTSAKLILLQLVYDREIIEEEYNKLRGHAKTLADLNSKRTSEADPIPYVPTIGNH
jgi:hypothetical protein